MNFTEYVCHDVINNGKNSFNGNYKVIEKLIKIENCEVQNSH